MSRSNILRQFPTTDSYIVVFKTSRGERAYEYTLAEGAMIAAGADPKHYGGTETDQTTAALGAVATIGELL